VCMCVCVCVYVPCVMIGADCVVVAILLVQM